MVKVIYKISYVGEHSFVLINTKLAHLTKNYLANAIHSVPSLLYFLKFYKVLGVF